MAPAPSQREVFAELVVTVVIPAVVLMGLSGPDRLGPLLGLGIALLPPIGWGVWGAVQRGRVSGIAVLALVSVLLTGGVGLFELEPGWIAVKEAVLPSVIGIGTILTARTRWAVLPTVLDVVVDPEKVHAAMPDDTARRAWTAVLQRGTVQVGALFFASALGNYALARWLVVSPAGTTAFNEELGQLTALSFPALMLPMMLGMAWVLKVVLDRLEALSGCELDDLLR